MRRWSITGFISATLLSLAAVCSAQQPGTSVAPVTPAKSGMVSYIQGAVYVDDALIPDPIVANFPYVKEGGELRTAEGRAEVAMNPGIMMRVGENSKVRMISDRFIDTRVELTQGAATAQLVEVPKDNQFTLVVKDATIVISRAGFYHFYAEPPSLKVFTGEARVTLNDETSEVSGGHMVALGGGKLSAQKLDKDDMDALDRWSGRRGELVSAANASAARNCGNASGFTGFMTVPMYRFAQGGAIPISNGYAASTPCLGNWNWNPYYAMWTYVPFLNRYCDPFWGYCYYNPMGAWTYFYQYPAVYYGGGRPIGSTPSRPVSPSNGATAGPAFRSITSEPSFRGGSSSSPAVVSSAPAYGGGGSAAAAGSSGNSAGQAAAGGHGGTVSAGGGRR
ncbi:MAG TPA: hypothetical protein VMU19_07090 [Bryobacteraceae bacterium]|nr:hypothetical protein [Bryobacteraceae bacterium]